MSTISRQQLAEIIGERTLETSSRKELTYEIAAYLLESGQKTSLDSLIRDVMAYRARHGIIEAAVTSAHRVDDKVLAEIKSILRERYPDAKRIILNSQIDTSVVGGVKVSLAHEQLDMTVRDKLDTFKRLTANIKE